jgi:Alpha-glutamyl/putrescinyl thymine pyrophosphorylase clade 2
MDARRNLELDYTGDWRKFATAMFKLEDADPGYMLLARAEMDHAKKLRYIMAWCTFYNPGLAAHASDFQGGKFYEFLRYVYPHAKRASERRHFRGQAGLKALAQWQSLYPKPEAMVEACFASSYLGVRKNMQHMAQMGDYFYWKLADIQDTVFHKPVDFTGCEKYMPKVPKQGADMIGDMENVFDLEAIMGIVTKHIGKLDHPFTERKLKLQEAETVCCVFKQHVVGDYKFGFRSAKAYKRLKGMVNETKTAQVLLDGLYAGGIWDEASLMAVGEHL